MWEAKADAGDPESMYRYGKSLKAMGDYRTLDNIAKHEGHRADRAELRIGGEETQKRAGELGSATAKLNDAKILIKSADEKDRHLAREYLRCAAEAKVRGGECEYAKILIADGSSAGDSESVFKGMSLLESAAKTGDLNALSELRTIYAQGVSAKTDNTWILPPNPTRVAEVDSYMGTLSSAGE